VVIIIIFDPSTIAFATFFVGALVGVIVPQLANLDPSPAVQQSVQLFLAFMAVMADCNCCDEAAAFASTSALVFSTIVAICEASTAAC